MNKKLATVLVLPFLALSGCSFSFDDAKLIDEASLIKDFPRETYSNSFTQEFIPNYWDAYGCGDPFAMRYNGMFYLYVSSKSMCDAVKGWKSKDLVHWEQCVAEGLEVGNVAEGPQVGTAFAPEVVYFNGWFYMCESQRGNGHYFLRSRSPEGPFVPLTGENIGERIDGSFFLDDDETLYFLRASEAGTRVIKLTEKYDSNGEVIDLLRGDYRQIEEAVIGGWTEGPGMFKRNGNYYLTFTGPNVVSAGYRTAYAYHTDEDEDDTFFASDAFNYGDFLTLNASDEFNGLGHSSSVMGPNMDSMYTVYHNLVALAGPYRHYNLTRLMFNGTEMVAEHPELHNNLMPQMPDFTSYTGENVEVENDFVLSNKTSEDRFTTEINLTGLNKKAIFSYVDANNYAYVKMSNSYELSLHNVVNGADEEIEVVAMNKKYDANVNHTYHIAFDHGKIEVRFDNMHKIVLPTCSINHGGKVGCENGTTYSFIGFTNEAFDSSQHSEYKQDIALADTYDEEISSITEDNIIYTDKTLDSNGYLYGKAIKLSSKKDHASYKVFMDQSGYYGLDLTIPTSMMGKNIGVRIDNGEIYAYKLNKYETFEDIIKVHVGNFQAEKGSHYITIYYAGDTVAFTRLSWYLTTSMATTFTHKLDTYMTTGASYVNSWKIKNGCHYALSGNRQIIYLGDERLRDYSIECDIAFDGEPYANTAGFILRGRDAAFATNDDVNSITGYYCGFNLTKVFVTECNYNQTIMGLSDYLDYESNEFHHLKASCIGNEITVYLDGELRLTYITNLGRTHGQVGFYTNGAAAFYKNLTITTIAG